MPKCQHPLCQRGQPLLFTRDDGASHLLRQPILLCFICWKFLASSFSGVATQPGQTLRDMVTLLRPSPLCHSDPRFFVWEPGPLPFFQNLSPGSPPPTFRLSRPLAVYTWNFDASVVSPYPIPQVLTVDARNHGDSFHSPDMSYEAMSQDLQDFLPQLGLVPCVLIGHSMGGKTAMLLALQRVSHPYPASFHPV